MIQFCGFSFEYTSLEDSAYSITVQLVSCLKKNVGHWTMNAMVSVCTSVIVVRFCRKSLRYFQDGIYKCTKYVVQTGSFSKLLPICKKIIQLVNHQKRFDAFVSAYTYINFTMVIKIYENHLCAVLYKQNDAAVSLLHCTEHS